MFLAQKNGFVALFGNLLRVLVTHTMTFIMISGLVWSSSVYSQNTVESDAARQKNILIVGDSLSAAYKLANNEGWPHLLQNELLEKGIDYRVVNASVSGATTAAGLQVMPKALREYQPQIVIIELGGNDGLQGKPVPYIKKNLQRLITMALDSGAKVILTGIKLPPNFGVRYTEPFYQQYVSLASEYDVVFLPFLLEGVAGHEGMMMDDGIHPSAAGQPRVLRNVWPVLEPLLVTEAVNDLEK